VKQVVLIATVLFLAVVAGQWTVNQRQTSPIKQAGGLYRVTYVYDGDTVKLDNGDRIRLIGIDTPESKDNPKLARDLERTKKDKATLLAMGKKAALYSNQLLLNKMVRLEEDVQPKDRYHRRLAYVYLEDGTFINDKIIRDGYAYPMTIPPNVRYADQFKQAFNEAREHKRGLWQ
jgi:micrococcal nuclease